MNEVIGFSIAALIVTFIFTLIGYIIYIFSTIAAIIYGIVFTPGLLYIWFLWAVVVFWNPYDEE